MIGVITCPHCGEEIEMATCDECGHEAPETEIVVCERCHGSYCDQHIQRHECEEGDA